MRLPWECYRKHPLLVLGDVAVWIAGTVVHLYAGKENFLGISIRAISSMKGVSA